MLQRIEHAAALYERLKQAILQLAPQWSLAPVVQAIQALLGVSLIVAGRHPGRPAHLRDIALGYEDVVDHDERRHDPILAVLAGKLTARRKNCAPVAGKSTLNRLELGGAAVTPYHKIGHDPAAIAGVFVDLFLDAHTRVLIERISSATRGVSCD